MNAQSSGAVNLKVFVRAMQTRQPDAPRAQSRFHSGQASDAPIRFVSSSPVCFFTHPWESSFDHLSAPLDEEKKS